jgi:hypothetical protein
VVSWASGPDPVEPDGVDCDAEGIGFGKGCGRNAGKDFSDKRDPSVRIVRS